MPRTTNNPRRYREREDREAEFAARAERQDRSGTPVILPKRTRWPLPVICVPSMPEPTDAECEAAGEDAAWAGFCADYQAPYPPWHGDGVERHPKLLAAMRAGYEYGRRLLKRQ